MAFTREDWVDELLRQAQQAHEQGRESAVAELLPAYLNERPDDDTAWFLLGDALRVLGLIDEAERALLKAIELSAEGDWLVQLTLAHLYKDTGNHVEAERWFELAADAEAASEQAWFWILRGSNFAGHGQFEQAEGCFRTAIGIKDEHCDEAHLNLGNVLRSQGKYADARRSYRQALLLTPDYALAARGLKSLEQIEDALALARRVSKKS